MRIELLDRVLDKVKKESYPVCFPARFAKFRPPNYKLPTHNNYIAEMINMKMKETEDE
jgi:hypothetical protein